MALTIADKLRIKEGMKLLIFHAPGNFVSHLSPLPSDVEVSDTLKDYQQIHWFVKSIEQMEKETEKIIGLLKEPVLCWIYYPKTTSKIKTDLTRDKGWDKLIAHKELKWLSLISFDETWSAFGMRLETAADKEKNAKPAPRAIFDYIDATTKTVRLPDDFAIALHETETAVTHFNSLSFSNKKEYVEWIVSAKREETRQQRVTGAVEKLEMKWKNPRNT